MEDKSKIMMTSEILKNPNIRVFSQKAKDGKITYIIAIDGDNAKGDTTVSNRLVLATTKGDYKKAESVIKQVIAKISREDGKVNINKLLKSMNTISEKHNIEFTKELTKLVQTYDSSAKEPILIERVNKLEKILKIDEVVSQEAISSSYLPYKEIDQELKNATTMDPNKLSAERKTIIANQMQGRIEELDSIRTPEDADRNKGSLIAYMEYAEQETNEDRVMAMYEENSSKWDLNTMVDCLKLMENENSEDSKLYSVYLRLEERRIIDRIQQELVQVKINEKAKDGEVERHLEHLDKSKLKQIDFLDMEQLENYIISLNLAKSISEYQATGRKGDFELLRYINGKNIDSKDEILGYLEAKIISLAQVNKEIGKTGGKLRRYIENTDYKSEDKADSNKFLLMVARMEKDYIQKKYGFIINEKKKEETSKLQSYEETLSGLEEEEKDLQEQYEQNIGNTNQEK